MQQLSGQDSMFLYLESKTSPMHVGALYIFDSEKKSFDLDAMKRFFSDRLHLSRIFRQRLVEVPMDMGHPFWVEDPKFDVNNHIFELRLEGKTDIKALAEKAAELQSISLDREKPLWEITFITGLTLEGYSSNVFAMYSKVHHAAIDGGGGVEIMAAILSMTEDPFVPTPPEKEWEPEEIPSAAELIAKSYGGALNTPKKLFQFVKSTTAKAFDIRKEVTKNLMTPPPLPMTAPKTIFNTTMSGEKVIGAVDIRLSTIKKIKNAISGATVNDAVLTICAGALRKYLVHTGRLPLKNLVAMAPISVRAEDEKGNMGNRVSAMLVDLATNEPHPLERLKQINQNTLSSKTMSKAIPADQIMEFIPSEVAATAGRVYLKMGLSKLHNPFFNVVITNVPGPPIPLYLDGFKMMNLYGFAPVLDGMGMMIAIFSYAGNVSITITSDKSVIKEMDVLKFCIQESIDELEDAVNALMEGAS